jgi:hypothetical protein
MKRKECRLKIRRPKSLPMIGAGFFPSLTFYGGRDDLNSKRVSEQDLNPGRYAVQLAADNGRYRTFTTSGATVTLDVCQTLFSGALDIHGDVADRWTFTTPDLTHQTQGAKYASDKVAAVRNPRGRDTIQSLQRREYEYRAYVLGIVIRLAGGTVCHRDWRLGSTYRCRAVEELDGTAVLAAVRGGIGAGEAERGRAGGGGGASCFVVDRSVGRDF